MATYVEVDVQLHDEHNESKGNVHRNGLATYAICKPSPARLIGYCKRENMGNR
jgi:hypothetical protein